MYQHRYYSHGFRKSEEEKNVVVRYANGPIRAPGRSNDFGVVKKKSKSTEKRVILRLEKEDIEVAKVLAELVFEIVNEQSNNKQL